jgi:hypothetical protein
MIAIQEIQTLEAKRARYLDTKNWALLESLQAPDLISDAAGSAPLVGAKAMIASVSAQLADSTTITHVHSPIIEFESADKARGIWAMEVMTTRTTSGRSTWRHAYGWYHVEYVRLNGTWKIASRKHERLRVDEGSGAPSE